jgi:hypothetical protein
MHRCRKLVDWKCRFWYSWLDVLTERPIPRRSALSFQAYLDNIEAKTGKTPKEFIAEAEKNKLTESRDIIPSLKKDYGLGHPQGPTF